MQRSNITLTWVGIVTWLVASSPLLVSVARNPALLASVPILGLFVACILFGLGFGPALRGREDTREDLVWVFIQVAAAITGVALLPFSPSGMPASTILFVVTAARLALLDQRSIAFTAIGLQSFVLWYVYSDQLRDPMQTVVFVGSIAAFQMFGFAVAAMAQREVVTSTKLAHTLDELKATRGALAASSKLTERMRIARELHDSIGHDLTALSLHLELARHQDETETKQTVETARSLCQLLLAELRDVLDDVRATDGADLKESIEAILTLVPEPKIELLVEDSLGVIDPIAAHVVLRCVQEIVTNTMRHAGARLLRIELRRNGDLLSVRAEDDGKGLSGGEMAADIAGSGMAGMIERVEELGGKIEFGAGSAGGTKVTLSVPLERRVS
jgi:signal transduction histidine kinase